MPGKGLNLGLNQKLYRNTGTDGTPIWTEINIAIDVQLMLDKSLGTVKARFSSWEMNLPALKKAGVEFQILGDTNNSNYDALRDSFINDTVLDLAVADQAITNSGAEYFRAWFVCDGFPIDQKLEEAETAKVTCKLFYNTTRVPAFFNVP